MAPLRFFRRGLFAALSPAFVFGACHGGESRADDGALVAQLAEIPPTRDMDARLSVGTMYAPCLDAVSTQATSDRLCHQTTAFVPDSRLRALAERIARTLQQSPNADALHAAALIDLMWPSDAEKSADRSISYLRRAAALSRAPAPVLSDLSAALMVRAQRTGRQQGSARDLLEALEAADRALTFDPSIAQAQFNRALTLERLGMHEQAMRAWTGYLSIDGTSPWADFARKHCDGRAPRYACGPVTARAPTIAPDVSPQAARALGWDTLLVAWGHAVLSGDSLRADALLERASAIGMTLERRGGDLTLADATRALRALHRKSPTTRKLAKAHAAYGDAMSAYRSGQYALARAAFSKLAYGGATSPLREWATVGWIAARLPDSPNAALAVGYRTIRHTDAVSSRYPALAARARWVTATSLIRAGRPEEALRLVDSASSLFARAGERENVGIMQVMAADARYAAGDVTGMHDTMHRALLVLCEARGSVWLHNLLYLWAEAVSDEMPFVAAELQEEGIGAAIATHQSAVVAEARLARARIATASGDTGRAALELATARPLIQAIPPGRRREWIEADLELAQAGLSMRSAPDDALRSLDRVVARFDTLSNSVRLLPALVTRAQARLAAGHDNAGESDLERAIELIDTQHNLLESIRFRATTLQAARRAFDRIVMRRIAAGRESDALAYMDRAHASLDPLRTARPFGIRAGRIAAPPGESALELAFVGDTLLAWSVVGDRVRLARSNVDHAAFLRVVQRVRSSLELGVGEAQVRADLATLYDWLIRPSAPMFGDDDRPVAIVADGEIEAVPFPALFDTAATRYLIERHALRFVPRLGDVRGPTTERHDVRTTLQRGTALLIADPAGGRSRSSSPDTLPGAHDEVRAIAQEYAHPRLLDGSQATRAAFGRAVRGVETIHFAGHAVFDDDRPERSHLVLANDHGAPSELTVSDVATLDLRGVRLVVLSACETARPESGRSGGYTGLTGSFLAAGARSVVGTLWRIDDASAMPLMVDFHRLYRRLGDPAAALRAAQIDALRSSEKKRRSPAAWAAFRDNTL